VCVPSHTIDPFNLVCFQPSSTSAYTQHAQTKDDLKSSIKKKKKKYCGQFTQDALLRDPHRRGQCIFLNSLVNNENQDCQEIHNSALTQTQ